MEIVDLISWAASISGMFAAILVALNAGAKTTGIGFIIFAGSSVLWITSSLLYGDSPLAVQNLVLFAINIFGIYRYLWQQPRTKSAKIDTFDLNG